MNAEQRKVTNDPSLSDDEKPVKGQHWGQDTAVQQVLAI